LRNRKDNEVAVQYKRLEKLANHLLTGKLGHEKFDFAVLNTVKRDRNGYPIGKFNDNNCGTMGCALGELPIVDPKNWTFERQGDWRDPYLVKLGKGTGSFKSAEVYFGITDIEADSLFQAGEESPWLSGKQKIDGLSPMAKKETVANSILKFIDWKKAGGTF